MTAGFLLAAGQSHAVEKSAQFHAGAGLAIPTNDIHAFQKTGFHVLAGVDYALSEFVGVLGNFHYFSFGTDDEILPDVGNLNVWVLSGALKYTVGSAGAPAKLYMLAGLGFAGASQEGPSSTDPAFQVGGGIDFGKFFGELRYVKILNGEDEASAGWVPLTLGYKF